MKLNTIQKPTKEKQPTKLKHIACSVHTPSNHPFISIRVLKWKHTCMLHIWQKLSAYTLHKHSAPSPFQKGFLALPPECQCMSERQSGYRGLNQPGGNRHCNTGMIDHSELPPTIKVIKYFINTIFFLIIKLWKLFQHVYVCF